MDVRDQRLAIEGPKTGSVQDKKDAIELALDHLQTPYTRESRLRSEFVSAAARKLSAVEIGQLCVMIAVRREC